MRIARHGALYVAETASEKEQVQRRLKEIDPALFLEKQITLTNEEVWCVVVDVGLDHPPITLLEWRDDEGRPIPYLSERLVARVAAFERDPKRLLARVVEDNARKVERDRADAHQAYEELAKDHARSANPIHAALLPRRGTGEKMRARRLAMERRHAAMEERLQTELPRGWMS